MQALGCQSRCAGAPRCTTPRGNAHRTEIAEERKVLYCWHPWASCVVRVHEAVEKVGGTVLRCSKDSGASGRWLELPVWMFDRATCLTMRITPAPVIDFAALAALQELLAAAAADGEVGLSFNTSGLSPAGEARNQNRGNDDATANTRSGIKDQFGSSTCSTNRSRRPTISKTHEVISKAKNEIWHRLLTHYLPLYFPEIECFAGNSRSDWFLAFLERFPTPGSVVSLTKDAFVADAWAVVGRKVSKSRLIGDIYETACTSAALPVPLDSPAIAMFRLDLAKARSLIQQWNVIETHAHELLRNHPDYLRLRQVPGIGPIHALAILAEAGDLRRFRHHRQFLKFCGLDLATHQSGLFTGRTRLSKFGNARLRRTFWLAAQVAIRQRDNSFRDCFGRHVAKDRENKDLRRKATIAVATKMARVVHALIKTGTDYRPFLEGPVPSGRTPLCRSIEGVT